MKRLRSRGPLHPYLPADYAFLDPDLTVGLPPKMTADTGFDALSHAVEAISSPGTNCMIDGLSIQAIKLILNTCRQRWKTAGTWKLVLRCW